MSLRIMKVGSILHLSKLSPNILIIKLTDVDYLKPGIIIFDKEGNKIGVVIETFGPVNNPHARVKIEPNIKLNLQKGDPVYIISSEFEEITWRKMPRRKRIRGGK